MTKERDEQWKPCKVQGRDPVQYKTACFVLSLLLPKKNQHIYKHNRLIGVETGMYRSFRLLLFSKYTVECYQLRVNNGEEI